MPGSEEQVGLAWGGELRGAGGAQVRRALCASGRTD